MSDSSKSPDHLERLLDGLVEGVLTDSEHQELARRLRSDESARAEFASHLVLHSMLKLEHARPIVPVEEAAIRDQVSEVSAENSNSEIPSSPVLGFLGRTNTMLSKPVLWSILGVGLMFFGYVAVITWGIRDHSASPLYPRGRGAGDEGAVATITDASDTQWTSASGKSEIRNPKSQIGATVASGEQLEIKSGIVKLKLKSGAILSIEGPAQWLIDGDNSTTLRSGKLIAKVPSQAIGFRVLTPTTQVVDLGTEFSVEVSTSGVTDIQVIRGTVEVGKSKLAFGNNPEQVVRLTAGQAVRANHSGLSQVTIAKLADDRNGQQKSEAGYIDLVDIVAGGDGRRHRRDRGIDPRNGSIVFVPDKDYSRFGPLNGRGYFGIADLPFIDGVAIIDPTPGPVQLTSAGHKFEGFLKSDGNCYGPIWAGGSVPEREGIPKFRSTFDGKLDYGQAPHGFITLIPNKLITFDLQAIRREHPSRTLMTFRSVVGMTKSEGMQEEPGLADTWVFVDGEVRHSRLAFNTTHGPQSIEIPLTQTARFLTLAATDGGNTYYYDWVFFGDPRIEFKVND